MMNRTTVCRRIRNRVVATMLTLTAAVVSVAVVSVAVVSVAVVSVGAHAQDAAGTGTAASGTAASGTAGSSIEPLSDIRNAARAYAQSLAPASARELTVSVGALDSRLRLAPCAARQLSASLPAGMSLQSRVTVGVSCAGPTQWTVYVPVSVESTVDVLVLTHAVARDARLTAADVAVESRRTAGGGLALLGSPGELKGRTVRRPLPAGSVLAVDMFNVDYVVHRGQQVTLLSSGGSVEVRAAGRAMADAGAGARIQVQNLSSQRIVEGVVESADLVRIARQ